MTQSVEIREWTAADLPAVHALILRTIDACYPPVYPSRAVDFFQRHHSPEAVRRRAEQGLTLVALAGDVTVATGTLVDDEIAAVFVEPERQGEGLGAALMDELERHAVATGLKALRLDVSLVSRGFYERLGYEVVEGRSIDVGEGQSLDYWRAYKALSAAG
jgi:GNAT superfamily N-acetyltransferase